MASQPVKRNSPIRGVFLPVLLSAIWGSSFILIRLAVRAPGSTEGFLPLTLGCFRTGVAAIILCVALYLRDKGLNFRPVWPALAVAGLLSAGAPFTLLAYAEQFVPSSIAAVSNATVPLFTVGLVTVLLPQERLGKRGTAGVLLGFGGVLSLFYGGLMTRLTPQLAVGFMACVMAALCYALGSIWVRRRLLGVDFLRLTTGAMFFGCLWVMPLAAIFERPWTQAPGIDASLALLGLGSINTAFAQVVYFHLILTLGAMKTAQITYFTPLFGLFWGAQSGERVTPAMGLSALAILLGVFLVNSRPRAAPALRKANS